MSALVSISFSRLSSLHSSAGILADSRATFCFTSAMLSAPGITAQNGGMEQRELHGGRTELDAVALADRLDLLRLLDQGCGAAA